MHGTTIEIRRITTGPSLVIEDAGQLVLDFFRTDSSSAPGGYDDQAGHGERDRVTKADIIAINTTMAARSPHAVWDALISSGAPQGWLVRMDPDWDLIGLDDETWQARGRQAIDGAIQATVGPGRGLSVATKVLHLKATEALSRSRQPGPATARRDRQGASDEGHRAPSYRGATQSGRTQGGSIAGLRALRPLARSDPRRTALGQPSGGRARPIPQGLAARLETSRVVVHALRRPFPGRHNGRVVMTIDRSPQSCR